MILHIPTKLHSYTHPKRNPIFLSHPLPPSSPLISSMVFLIPSKFYYYPYPKCNPILLSHPPPPFWGCLQIANLVTLQGQSEPLVRNVMTLNTCAPIVGADVMAFKTEQELLLAWRVREI